MFGVNFTRALREALPTQARGAVLQARLPPIPIGPSSSRWASTYVHLGDLADNKGAREDVSIKSSLRKTFVCSCRFRNPVSLRRTSVWVEVGRQRRVEHQVEVTRVRKPERETGNQRPGSRVVKRQSHGCSLSEDSRTCTLLSGSCRLWAGLTDCLGLWL